MQSPWNHCVNVSFCSGKVTGTNATTSAAGSSDGGCKSVLGGLSVLLIAAGAALTLAKRKHS